MSKIGLPDAPLYTKAISGKRLRPSLGAAQLGVLYMPATDEDYFRLRAIINRQAALERVPQHTRRMDEELAGRCEALADEEHLHAERN